MEVTTSVEPAKRAGTHISKVIATHDGDVVCLLAGGSALDMIPHIKNPEKAECRTIFMLGDERGSRDAMINNSLQIVTKYPDSYVAEHLILTVPNQAETLENFTSGILETFLTKTQNLKNPKIIQVLGVGLDGHTAGIFPLPITEFTDTYNRPDQCIVPVHLEGLKIDSRASFTPMYILTKVDEVIGYVVGSNKKLVLESLINEGKAMHERPAELIKQHPQATLYTDQLL